MLLVLLGKEVNVTEQNIDTNTQQKRNAPNYPVSGNYLWMVVTGYFDFLSLYISAVITISGMNTYYLHNKGKFCSMHVSHCQRMCIHSCVHTRTHTLLSLQQNHHPRFPPGHCPSTHPFLVMSAQALRPPS